MKIGSINIVLVFLVIAFSIGSCKEYHIKDDYNRAKEIIEIYERGLDIFNEDDNTPTNEFFLYKKGLYSLGIGQNDSASYYFYRLLERNTSITSKEAAYKGLLMLYRKEHKEDSVLKYSKLYSETYDTTRIIKRSDNILRIQSVYNYNLHKEKANVLLATLEEERHKMDLYIIGFISIVIIIALALFMYLRHKKKERRLLIDLYKEKVKSIKRLNLDNEGKNAIIQQLKDECEALRNTIGDKNLAALMPDGDQVPMDQIVSKLHSLTQDVVNASYSVTSEDWRIFFKQAEKDNPDFYKYIAEKGLSKMEMKVALLLKSEFTDQEVSALLDSYGSSYTNCKARINSKLFNIDSAKELKKNIFFWK